MPTWWEGFTVLIPVAEHTPFDLVAYASAEFQGLQVKYRSVRSGALKVQFCSMWADRHGTNTTPMDEDAIDFVCIYCPETDDCYYVRPGAHGTSVTLRCGSPLAGMASRQAPCTPTRSVCCRPQLMVESAASQAP
jgi:hypothetical protein